MHTLRINNASRASRHTLYSHASIRARTRPRARARARAGARWASAAVRGSLIILLNRPRSYCNACAFARAHICACVGTCMYVYVRTLNGTINLLCRRGDCRDRRKLFGAIECELRYCAPESKPLPSPPCPSPLDQFVRMLFFHYARVSRRSDRSIRGGHTDGLLL